MQAEADIDLKIYLDRAPDPTKDPNRFAWHMERYRFATSQASHTRTIADVGCGWGFGTEYLGGIGEKVVGFEINTHLVEYSTAISSSTNVSYETHDVLEGKLPHGPYDLICMFEVIEHLEDPRKGVSNIKGSLSEKGSLIVSTPNIVEDEEGDHPFHVSEFSYAPFLTLLESEFSSVKIHSQGNPIPVSLWRGNGAGSRIANVVRSAYVLHMRQNLPPSVRMCIRGIVNGSYQRSKIPRDVQRIAPGFHEEANWMIAVCSS